MLRSLARRTPRTRSAAAASALAVAAVTAAATPVQAGSGTGGTVITFDADTRTTWGESVLVVGSSPELGAWDPARAVPLSSAAYPRWSASVVMERGTQISFKYVIREPNGSLVWEQGNNRTMVTPYENLVFTTADTFRRDGGTPASGIAADCAAMYESWRYTTAVNGCGVPYSVKVLYQSGAESECRMLGVDEVATFPGFGPAHDHVVALAHC
ncbi:carbohydrate-binding module family 20 domain-containing protein [Streptomyces vinaceus]|uniref:carbohydrate-binding module family 20 domain-containing protein n=1 Tax=Streptomyces vinaceus TaxID=1960 RepID=UPI00381DEA3E